jgi:hypothetical protein
VRDFFHRLVVREFLLSLIEPDTDQIIEIGGGAGDNLFQLWLGCGPRSAEYLCLDIDRSQLSLSQRMAVSVPGLGFRAGYADIGNLDIGSMVTGRKVFLFTCQALTMARTIPPEFFQRLLAPKSIYAGAHIESGSWQILSDDESAEARLYAEKHGRNVDLFERLEEAQTGKLIGIDQVILNSHCTNPLAPNSLISWRHWGAEAPYTIGDVIDFTTDNSHRFLRAGWSDQESWGRWSDGAKAELQLALHEIPSCGTLMRIEMHAFTPPGEQGTQVFVDINGVRLATVLATGNARVYEIPVPSSAWRPFGVISLSFTTSRVLSPRSLGISEDERHLGIAIKSLQIIAA